MHRRGLEEIKALEIHAMQGEDESPHKKNALKEITLLSIMICSLKDLRI